MAKAKNTLPAKPVKNYFEYLEEMSGLGNNHLPKETEFYIRKAKLLEGIITHLPSVVYLVDYRTRQYLYLSPNVEQMVGFTSEEIVARGHKWWVGSRLHPDDVAVFSSDVFTRFLAYTRTIARSEIKKMRFSVNMRARRKDERYMQALQQYVVLEMDEDSNPILVLGTWTDITAHKSDNKVVFSVSKYDRETGFSVISTDTFPHGRVHITPRENEIIRLLIEGRSSKLIAVALKVSLHTVNAHRRNILEKTKCKNAAELVSYALANGLG